MAYKDPEKYRKWRENNRQKLLEYGRDYASANPEKKREYNRKYAANNLDKIMSWKKNNPDKVRQIKRRYYKQTAAKQRELYIRSKYGLSSAQFNSMLDQQSGVCAICEDVPPTAVDHDHDTGRVRGLLCANCNFGIGFLRDSARILNSAVEYLAKHLSTEKPIAHNKKEKPAESHVQLKLLVDENK